MRSVRVVVDPRDVLDEMRLEEILEYISGICIEPEAIFTTTQLSEWAEDNGYTKEQ